MHSTTSSTTAEAAQSYDVRILVALAKYDSYLGFYEVCAKNEEHRGSYTLEVYWTAIGTRGNRHRDNIP